MKLRAMAITSTRKLDLNLAILVAPRCDGMLCITIKGGVVQRVGETYQ